jgi:hypothetical protein
MLSVLVRPVEVIPLSKPPEPLALLARAQGERVVSAEPMVVPVWSPPEPVVRAWELPGLEEQPAASPQ